MPWRRIYRHRKSGHETPDRWSSPAQQLFLTRHGDIGSPPDKCVPEIV
jgi:hypothetical protein